MTNLRVVQYSSVSAWLSAIERGKVQPGHAWDTVRDLRRVPKEPGSEWYGAESVAAALAAARHASVSPEADLVRTAAQRLSCRLRAPRATRVEMLPSPVGRMVDYAAYNAGIEPCTWQVSTTPLARPNIHVLLDAALPAFLPAHVFTTYAASIAACCQKLAEHANVRVTVTHIGSTLNFRSMPKSERSTALRHNQAAYAAGYVCDVKPWHAAWHAGTLAWSLCALAAARILPFAWQDVAMYAHESAKLGRYRGYPMPAATYGYVASDHAATATVRVPWVIDALGTIPLKHVAKESERARVTDTVTQSVIGAFAPHGVKLR